jgi:hypothetical protein
MALNNTQILADKIARMLESEAQTPETAALFAGIEKINHRLDKLEAALSSQPPVATQLPHPSQDKFAVIEAFADEIIAGIKQEKTCTFEPNGRPCDHCSMCSSRGF